MHIHSDNIHLSERLPSFVHRQGAPAEETTTTPLTFVPPIGARMLRLHIALSTFSPGLQAPRVMPNDRKAARQGAITQHGEEALNIAGVAPREVLQSQDPRPPQ